MNWDAKMMIHLSFLMKLRMYRPNDDIHTYGIYIMYLSKSGNVLCSNNIYICLEYTIH